MTFDLDEAIERLEPWDFAVKIGGEVCPTRRPLVAEVEQLSKLGDLSAEQGYALLNGLFDPPVQLQPMGIERVTGFLAAYLAYFRNKSLKNSQAIAAEVRAAMAPTPKT